MKSIFWFIFEPGFFVVLAGMLAGDVLLFHHHGLGLSPIKMLFSFLGLTFALSIILTVGESVWIDEKQLIPEFSYRWVFFVFLFGVLINFVCSPFGQIDSSVELCLDLLFSLISFSVGIRMINKTLPEEENDVEKTGAI